MGSSLESAICFTAVLALLAFFIVCPTRIREDALISGKNARDEIIYHMNDRKPIRTKRIGKANCNDISPEVINTMIIGIVDMVKTAGG